MKKLLDILALSVVTLTIGCGTSAVPKSEVPSHVHSDGTTHVHGDGKAHSHGTTHTHGAGPHGGTLADWGGGKYHVELTVDHSKKELVVYLLESDEKTPAAIDSATIEVSIQDPEMIVTLSASPQDGEVSGKSSRFVGNHDLLGNVKDYAGSITGVVSGTPYTGEFDESSGAHSH